MRGTRPLELDARPRGARGHRIFQQLLRVLSLLDDDDDDGGGAAAGNDGLSFNDPEDDELTFNRFSQWKV